MNAHAPHRLTAAWRSQRGSSVVEVVILAPALGLLVALVIAGGRVALAHQAVQASAADAARAASISRTHDLASQAAAAAARSTLAQQDTRCVSTSVTVDTSGFATPAGSPAAVSATVACEVDLAGLLPGLPGSMTITATMTSPLDTYRER